ncbi:lipase family protein [Nocardia sp. NPDC051900]|uniref:lipase family protein n=1 Tax=Nocardia sp. NPDC051900 TaxID=3364326 RepID=UPI0037ABCFC0
MVPAGLPPDLAVLDAAVQPTPVGDPFFDVWPAQLGKYRPGQVIEIRDVTSTVSATAGVQTRSVLQLKFRTADSRGAPSYGTATLMIPAAPWRGPGNRPVVVQAMAVDGLGIACTPGYSLLHDDSAGPVSGLGTPSTPQWGIAQGFAVLVPDHEGPRMAYAEPTVAGHVVLDSIRAVRNLLPAEFGDTRYAMYGYSGGAIAARSAAVLIDSYAPDVAPVIVGAGIGGVPADYAQLTETMNGNLASGTLLGAVFGIAREHPEVLPQMSPAARAVATSPAKDDCGNLMVAYGVLGFPFDLAAASLDPLHSQVAAKILRITDMNALKSAVPLYIYNGKADPWIRPAMARELFDRQCSLGTAAVYRSVEGEHFIAEKSGVAGVRDWLAQRLRGVEVPDECAR